MKYLINGCLILLSVTQTLNSLPQVLNNISDKEIDVGNSTLFALSKFEPTEEESAQCEIRRIQEVYSINFTLEEMKIGDEDDEAFVKIVQQRVFELSGILHSDIEIFKTLFMIGFECAFDLIDEKLKKEYGAIYGVYQSRVSECLCRSIEENFKVKIPREEFSENMINGKFEENKKLLEQAGINLVSWKVRFQFNILRLLCLPAAAAT